MHHQAQLLHTFAPLTNIDHLTNIAAFHTCKPVKLIQAPERVNSHPCLKDREVDGYVPHAVPRQKVAGCVWEECLGGGVGLYSSTLPLPGESWSGKEVRGQDGAWFTGGTQPYNQKINSSPGPRSHHICCIFQVAFTPFRPLASPADSCIILTLGTRKLAWTEAK